MRNGSEAAGRIADAFRSHFPAARMLETKPTTASEDFGSFGRGWQVPSVFWFVGGNDPDEYPKPRCQVTYAATAEICGACALKAVAPRLRNVLCTFICMRLPWDE